MTFLKRLAVVTLSLGGLSPAVPALAQSFGADSTQPSAWVQIEARPSLAQAMDRARAYAGLFPNVEGFGLSSGWFAIVLGPYDERTARITLSRLLAQGMIPPDSFLSDGSRFTAQYWPEGNAGPGTTAQSPLALSDQSIASAPLAGAPNPAPDAGSAAAAPAAPAAPVAQAPAAPAPETPAEARRSEAQLSAADRKDLQSALQWYGFYASTIDGAFGPGTRNAMAAWQQAQGDTPTGILTTAERDALLGSYRGAMADLGMQQVDDTTAGISVAMPTKLVQFGDYAPPFAHYTATGGSGVQVILISQPGGQETLQALYNAVQRLAIVPASGPRSLAGRSFDITGQGDNLMSYTHAEIVGGAVKGFTLVWPPAQNARMERVLAAMKQSFRALNGNALDATAVPISAAERQGLLAGLELKKPAQAASGFYVDARGQVLTSAALVAQCQRVTIGNGHAARVAMSDPQLGIALLSPEKPLTPVAYARFGSAPPARGSEVVLAGYSYAGQLGGPTVTYGKLAALTGLAGEDTLRRLSLDALSGDAGGPVLDGSGAVIGILKPHQDSTGKELPRNVSFAVASPAISSALAQHGVTVSDQAAGAAMKPGALNRLGREMTVLVSCWN